jgi:lipid A oxidase
MILKTLAAAVFLTSSALASAASATDLQFSVYGGYQTASPSKVTVSDGTTFNSDWEGGSFKAPPYYGVRGTYWLDDFGYDNIGASIDFSHTKIYASQATLDKVGWSHFEFTDGMNLLTANLFYRFQQPGRAWTPYLGAGLGVDIPHVEVIRPSGTTWDYQLGGISAQLTAGVDYKLTESWSVFSEYKLNYSRSNVSIDSGDTLKTNVFTHAIDLGVSFHF